MRQENDLPIIKYIDHNTTKYRCVENKLPNQSLPDTSHFPSLIRVPSNPSSTVARTVTFLLSQSKWQIEHPREIKYPPFLHGTTSEQNVSEIFQSKNLLHSMYWNVAVTEYIRDIKYYFQNKLTKSMFFIPPSSSWPAM